MTKEHPSICDRIKIKLKKKFAKPNYGKAWPEKDDEWYSEIHDANYLLHKNFVEYLKNKKDIKDTLEIGCGTGIYPLKNKKLFENLNYTGIDISSTAIEYCKNNSNFKFICGDFIKMEINQKFDLVYTHAVIDHVYDVNEFVSKIVDATKKYAYINSYRGYFPKLDTHKMIWDGHNACYFNDVSIKEIKEILLQKGLDESEFIIRSQESGQKDQNVNNQLVIEITKKQ